MQIRETTEQAIVDGLAEVMKWSLMSTLFADHSGSGGSTHTPEASGSYLKRQPF